MSTKPVALILGAGPNVGLAISTSFTILNYRVATASRSGTNSINPDTGILTLKADFTAPTSIPNLFSLVLKEYGTSPSVVVWNAAALTPPPVEESVLSISQEQFAKDLNVNTVSPYVAAQEAVKSWESMGEEHAGDKKTFIYTGNTLNQTIAPVPLFLTLGVGKSASAHWVGMADALYKEKGYRFFYADQRQHDGAPMVNGVDGPAHGAFYAQLVQQERDVPWLATFVKDKGYVKF
ncbi:hypothetical protein J4E86_011589 [Alternaria arbusti]|uniref:uncharacterized protein n=1 Tax=Alternaria arbusti TaxID=232088 RepID=UPI00221FCCEF|nr:uncharacterized protein J4E86_011589 [Alternaria arbusti]KAI4605548.1 hypothetical protein J4E80_010610 [Alternaria sp. BMP 0032]KAI4933319.1 hypothetical protein J4E86_011589 [Alternaria arbusti]